MTRFWITLNQAVDFVLSSLELMEGGEIFVPKIPSMTTSDLAGVLAPGIKQEITGVRPGEKIHETMITVDDARNTRELADRYIVYPSFRSPASTQGNPVGEDFVYSSDSNPEQISPETLVKMIEE